MTSNTTVALHHILLKSPLLADDIVKELELGADFADLAKEYSACPSANNEGFAGYHNLDTLPTGIVKALSAWDGETPYTKPARTQFGLHILKPVSKLERQVITDDDADEFSNEEDKFSGDKNSQTLNDQGSAES